jgi:DNA-binding NtrC family response regulator
MGASVLSWVWLAPHRDQPGRPSGEGPRQPGNGHPNPPTVLVVEDEVLIRLAVCDYLRHFDYRVLEGSTADEAQRVFRSGEPVEVLFSDIDLGSGMDGFALAHWVRQHYPEVRILLTSGVATRSAKPELGDVPFFSKPYSHEALEAQIRRLLDLFGRQGG